MLRRTVAPALAVLALAPAAASADTIVYQKAGDIRAIRPDGSGDRLVAQGAYAWPSQSDAGTIAAVDGAGAIHRLTPKGAEIGAPLPTAATQATEDLPAEPPTHVRISPDGTKIAYDELIADDATTLWTPANATGLDLPGQTTGQDGLEAPSWIGSDRLLLSRDVTALADGEPTFARYAIGGGDDSAEGWFSDAREWPSSFEAAAARSGGRIAVLADDSAELGGIPSRVELRLYDGDAQPQCDIALPAGESLAHTSPSFSPDGTKLAWAEADGIHVGSCGGKRDVIAGPGAYEPYWSAASDTTAPPPTGQQRLTLRVSVRLHPLRVRVACTTACAITIRLRHNGRTLTSALRRLKQAGAVTVRLHTKLTRFRLRVSAPGASPVSRAVRVR